MLQKIIKAGLVMLVVLFIASMLPLGGAAIKIVPLGWLNFLARTLTEVSLNWSGIGMVLLCSVIMIFALQWFLNWLYPGLSSPRATWRWRWTISLYAFFWILFAVAIGASGLMRHTTWLFQVTEPIYKPRENAHMALRVASSELETALIESQGDFPKAQWLLATSQGRGFGSWDQHQFVFVTDESNRVEKAMIIPRNPEAQRKAGFAVVGGSMPGKHQPIERLPEFLKSR